MSEPVHRRALAFDCEGTQLVAVAELPEAPRHTALLAITGGPQYRVGSHRQFALLARVCAASGFAAMTFDCRGSGDSPGERVSFEAMAPDIRAAVDVVCGLDPAIRQVVLLGLCDGASAALMYAPADARVAGLVMLNPWVRVEGSLEKARLRGYYPSKLLSAGFWKRLLRGDVRIIDSLRSFGQQAVAAGGGNDAAAQGFLSRMLVAVGEFAGPLLVVLAGRDMTAQEYRDLLSDDRDWRRLMNSERVTQKEISGATHTFSSSVWRDEVAHHCVAFLAGVEADSSG